VRHWISPSIGVIEPMSLPTLVTCTPTIVRGPPKGDPAGAIGRNPSSAIFITRAAASVVEAQARAGFSDGLRAFCSSVTVEIASSTRRWKSRAAASRASSVALRCNAACSRHSSSDSQRRNDGAVAAARIRMPSERQHVLVDQRREDVGHQAVERGAVVDAERRQRVMPDLKIAHDPTIRVVALHQAGDLSRAAHADRDRGQPQRQLHLRRQRVPPQRAPGFITVLAK